MSKYRDALLGVAIGDALGVPVEFRKREDIAQDPVLSMREYGVHGQPAGTWSDDSSLTFCLADSLTRGFNCEDIGKSFVAWLYDRHWTPHGKVFDIGNTTRNAIDRIARKHPAESAGPKDEGAQGNGSLMRILPLVFYIKDKPIEDRWDITRRVSNITHGYINCAFSCFVYLEAARLILIYGKEKPVNFFLAETRDIVTRFIIQYHSHEQALNKFHRILSPSFAELDVSSIRSTGYVIDTLEAAFWCFLNTDSYVDAVLRGVNLGEDTDTTGAVVGGLAGLYYGLDNVPKGWLDCLARRWDIEDLAERLEAKYGSK